MVGSSESFAMLLLPTLNEARAEGVVTRREALLHLMKSSRKEKIRASEQRPATRDAADEALEILVTLVLSHIDCEGFDFGPKIAYFAAMLRRMLCAILDSSYLEDRDYYGNKRLDLAGVIAVRRIDLGNNFSSSFAKPVPQFCTPKQMSWLVECIYLERRSRILNINCFLYCQEW